MKKIILSILLVSLLIPGNICVYAQSVGVSANGATPNSSALLDIDASSMTPKKGLLIPRVQLTSTTDVATILSPETSLMVYNTGSTGIAPNNVKPGYYYYNGTKWVDRIGTTSAFVDVYNSTGATITCNVYTKIIFDTEVKDDDGIYNNSTGRLNLPSGKWKISSSMFKLSSATYANQVAWLAIYKNGVGLKAGPLFNIYSNQVGAIVDAIVESNGTDYFEIYGGFSNCGADVTFLGGSGYLWMQAVKISN